MGQENEPATKRDFWELHREINAKLDAIDARREENARQMNRLFAKMDKFDGYFNRIITTLDGLAANYARVDQEQVVMKARLDRVESDVDKNKRDINQIKTKLAM